MANSKASEDKHPQYARFLETARALGCDEDGAAFDEKLKAVVGPKAKDSETSPASEPEVANKR